MSTIFKNYIEIINFVLSHFPYEKIIQYSRNLHYPWTICYGKNRKTIIRYPTKTDIKEYLTVLMCSYFCSDAFTLKLRQEKEENQENSVDTLDVSRITSISNNYQFKLTSDYFNIKFQKDRTCLMFKYSYKFHGRFYKYALPHYRFKWGDKKTEVVFRFKEKIII